MYGVGKLKIKGLVEVGGVVSKYFTNLFLTVMRE